MSVPALLSCSLAGVDSANSFCVASWFEKRCWGRAIRCTLFLHGPDGLDDTAREDTPSPRDPVRWNNWLCQGIGKVWLALQQFERMEK